MTPLGQGEMGNEGISSISKPWPLLAFEALCSAGSAVKSAGFLMLFSITYFKDDVIDFQKQQVSEHQELQQEPEVCTEK